MLHKNVDEGHTFMGGWDGGGWGVDCNTHLVFMVLAYYWGCARGFGRGTLYMKWGQGNQRFATMRLRGEKDKREKEKKRKKSVKIL